MKTILMSSVVVLSMASLAAAAEEMSSSFSWGDVTFQPRVYAGYADYELKSGSFDSIYKDPNGSIISQGNTPLSLDLFKHEKIKIDGPIFGIGVTVASGQFFGDFYYQSTLDEKAYSSADQQGIRGGVPYNLYLSNVDAQHADWAISIGYLLNEQWSVFAGYKSGGTDWDQSFRYNVRSIENSSLISSGSLDGKFDQDGPFLGTSYSFLIGPGTLTFKAAYAYLDGTYKWNYNQEVYPPFSGNEPFNIIQRVKLDGNSNAFSLGISWTQSLADNLGISIGANYHQYKFSMSGSSNVDSQNTSYQDAQISGGDLTEELFTMTASLFYRF